MSKIIDLEVLGNFKERQDAVNEDKFLKRSNVTANGNEVKIVTTEADSDQGISEVSYTALTPNSSLNASKITGVIDISHIPASAQERVVTVANATARKALTTNDVQKGDVVKETDTGLMYFVVDDTKLNQDAGYTAFAAGIASSADTVKLTPTRADSNYALVYADATTITSATTKGLAVASHSSTAANCPIRVNPGVNNSTSQGYATLLLGNNINNGTAYNKQGRIILYGTNTGYTTIVPGYASTSNITLTLPSATGTIALTSSNITGSSASCTGNAATATSAAACTGNSASATYATNVRITPSDGTTAYPVTMLNGSTASTDYALRTAVNNTTVANSGLKCIPGADVAANTEGTTTLVIGNALAKATADNRTGNIRIHGNNTGYTTIKPGYNSTSNITLTLPSATGTIALTSSDITGNAATATTATSATSATTATTATNSNNVKSTISTGTYYSVLGVAGGTATNTQATPQRGNATNISFRDGANAATAYSDFLVGNSTAATSSASAARTGRLFLYGTGAYYVAFTPGANTANATVTTTINHNLTVKSAAAVTLTLPSSTGTLALTSSDITGNAATATKLGTATKGSATQPIYLNAGAPTACTYTISKSVPSDAKFTDTTYSAFVKSGSTAAAGLVPKPSTTAGTTKFLCEDATWKTIPAASLPSSASPADYVKAVEKYCIKKNYASGNIYGGASNQLYKFYNVFELQFNSGIRIVICVSAKTNLTGLTATEVAANAVATLTFKKAFTNYYGMINDIGSSAVGWHAGDAALVSWKSGTCGTGIWTNGAGQSETGLYFKSLSSIQLSYTSDQYTNGFVLFGY